MATRTGAGRRISGKECTIQDRTPCEVRVALGMAADDAQRTGAPNAPRLQQLARRLDRGGSVSEVAARRELTAYVRSTLRNPASPARARTRAQVLADALHLGV